MCVCVALCACACACVRAWRGVPPQPELNVVGLKPAPPRQPAACETKSTLKVYETLSVKWSKIMAIFNRMRLRTSIYNLPWTYFCLLA